MSHDVTPEAYKTRLGNLTAKSVLALIADTVNEDGYGWPSVAMIAWKTEIQERTVMRVIQVFADMGLITKVDRGRSKAGKKQNFGIQLAMDKMGLDLREEFAEAFKAAQGKTEKAGTKGLRDSGLKGRSVRPKKCLRDSVSETGKDVSETFFSVSETVPPHPHIGGTVLEPVMNLPPCPPQAGEMEFNAEQLVHLEELRAAGRRADAAMWEGWYCEQNLNAVKATEEERANAKRVEMLRQTLADEPSAVNWVMSECGFSGDERRRGVRGAIAAVIALELEKGCVLSEIAPAMVEAWSDYNRIFDLLAVPYGPLKFFRLGIWARRNSWRIDEKKRERLGAAVGSAR